MVDYMNLSFAALLKEVSADGVVDEPEVKNLRARIFADGVVDQPEAEFLFQLNDAVSGNANHPSWGDFFVEAISSYLLADEKTPGVVDEDEAQWLIKHIEKDGNLDEIEVKLLRALKAQAKSLAPSLASKLAEWKI